ncbi:MAG TPA: RNA methyltransferase [Anaerolineales bacterium]|nr:RNA methyltransferase [Anaerolineales bacterium]
MLTSTQNTRVKETRLLQSQRKLRSEKKMFVLEGVRLVQDAFQQKADLAWVFVTPDCYDAHPTLLHALSKVTDLHVASAEVLASCSDTQQPQGIVAVTRWQLFPVPRPLKFALILDDVRDPGNMGTILRTAAAADVQAVWVSSQSVDVYSPKVVRAAMGAHFRLPIFTRTWAEIAQDVRDLQVWSASAHGEVVYHQVDWQQPSALLVSNEAHGLSHAAQNLPQRTVRIPMANQTESLNVSSATAVLLMEAARQRAVHGYTAGGG